MNIVEYANKKLTGYKNLGWEIFELTSTDTKVLFKSKDTSGIFRKHTYSDELIEVINIDITDVLVEEKPVIKKTKRTKKANDE